MAQNPDKAVLAKALFGHLCTKFSATDDQGKKAIQQEVFQFMTRRGETNSADLADLEGRVAGKMGAHPGPSGTSRGEGGRAAGPAPAPAPAPGSEAEKFMLEMSRRDVKLQKGKRLTEILKEKREDPWGKMVKHEADMNRRDDSDFRQSMRDKKLEFKRQLDQQVKELQERRALEARELAREVQAERDELEAQAREDQVRREQQRALTKQLLQERRAQMRDIAVRRAALEKQRQLDCVELNARIAAEQAAAAQLEQEIKQENIALMKSYMAESERSQVIKEAALRREAEEEVRIKAQWVADMERKDALKLAQRENMRMRQNTMEDRAKRQEKEWAGKVVSRVIEDDTIEKYEREFAMQAELAEDAEIERKAREQRELKEALDEQVMEKQVRDYVKGQEKLQWRDQFAQENIDIAREKEEKLMKKVQKKKKWTAELNAQMDAAWASQAPMSDVEIRLNHRHPVLN